MKTQLRKEDIKVADQLMTDLNTKKILSQEDYRGVQYKRIIAVLYEHGYIKDVHSHIQTTDYTPLYSDNGGAQCIYDKQQREQKIAKWQYSNMKWTNIRSWIAIAVSSGAILWEVLKWLCGR